MNVQNQNAQPSRAQLKLHVNDNPALSAKRGALRLATYHGRLLDAGIELALWIDGEYQRLRQERPLSGFTLKVHLPDRYSGEQKQQAFAFLTARGWNLGSTGLYNEANPNSMWVRPFQL